VVSPAHRHSRGPAEDFVPQTLIEYASTAKDRLPVMQIRMLRIKEERQDVIRNE